MSRKRLALAGVVALGGITGYWMVRSSLASRSAERVEYTVERTLDADTEIRRYPELVLVETTATSDREAFGRLFRYLDGANESRSDVAMTTPVRTDDASDESSDSIAMTAPVRTDVTEGDERRMWFYLPSTYTPNTAPRPTDAEVRLTVEPPRSLAVRTFSWWATERRTNRQQEMLEETLAAHDVSTVGGPFCLQYDAPGTPPFLRTNEVAIEVAW